MSMVLASPSKDAGFESVSTRDGALCQDASAAARISQCGLVRRIFPSKPSENCVLGNGDRAEDVLVKEVPKPPGAAVFADGCVDVMLSVDRGGANLKPAEKETIAVTKLRSEPASVTSLAFTNGCNVNERAEKSLFDVPRSETGQELRDFAKLSSDVSSACKRSRPTSMPVFTYGFSQKCKKPQGTASRFSKRNTRRPTTDSLPVASTLTNNGVHVEAVDSEFTMGNRGGGKGFERQCSTPKSLQPLDSSSCKNATQASSLPLIDSGSAIPDEGSLSMVRDERQRSYSFSYSQSHSEATNTGVHVARHSRIQSLNDSTDLSSCFSKEIGSSSSSSSYATSDTSGACIDNTAEKPLTTRSPLKFLNARMVAERLVRALTRERSRVQSNASVSVHTGDVSNNRVVEGGSFRDASGRKAVVAVTSEVVSSRPKDSKGQLPTHFRSEDKSGQTCSECRQTWQIGKETNDFSTSEQNCTSSAEENKSGLSCQFKINDAGPGRFVARSKKHIQNNDAWNALEARAKAKEEQAALLGRKIRLFDDQRTVQTDLGSEGAVKDALDALQQEVRKIRGENRALVLEAVAEIRSRLSEQVSANEAFQHMKEEMEAQVKLLEKRKVDVQEMLEEELERRTAEWTSKLEKIKVEEKRLKERLREVAEEKVGLQKEVSSLALKERVLRGQLKESQFSVDILKQRAEEANSEITSLKQSLADSLKRTKLVEDERDNLTRTFEDKEMETLNLHRAVAQLQKFCKDQERTIHGLWQALDEAVNGRSEGKGEHIIKLQRELLRLTGVEQGLRNELEVLRREEVSLKQENKSLIDRQKIVDGGGTIEMLRHDRELRAQTDGLRAHVISLQDENRKLSVKWRAALRGKRDAEMTSRIIEMSRGDLEDGDINMHNDPGRKMVVHDQERSRQQVEEKVAVHCDLEELGLQQGDCSVQAIEQLGGLQQKLKAKTLFCKVLYERLHSREIELEQLHGEMSTLLHSRDWMQTEVDSLQDALCTANQRVRELEHQICHKDEGIRGLEGDLEEQLKRVGTLHEELSQVRGQRDDMRKEIDDRNKEVLRLSAEVEVLTRKVEKLDDDLMVKEGQLSILRGTFDHSD